MNKYLKKKFLTKTEKKYYKIFNDIKLFLLKENNFEINIVPQVSLASVVKKHGKYRNELFRIIDYGIFDKNFNLLFLIEINDKTHYTADRAERDKKVKNILKQSNIKLLTFRVGEESLSYIRNMFEAEIKIERNLFIDNK